MEGLKTTPLHDLHIALGAKMVEFAGYAMPLQYRDGILKEHLHTRAAAGLFDVSHMGQLRVTGADAALETLVPVDVIGLPEGRQRYAMFTDDAGGILDDLMIARHPGHLALVVNAATKAADLAHLREHLGDAVAEEADRALLALQGPGAEAALGALAPGAAEMRFMDVADLVIAGRPATVSRSGYTGEDGYEISVAAGDAVGLAEALLAQPGVAPIGLGARDSLRLEAGLCLYGSDIDTGTTPVEAGLSWAIQKVRRPGGARAGGYPGAEVIARQLAEGAPRRRVGLRPDGRAPMRAGTTLHDARGDEIGAVTSGGFGPSVEGPVAMGYVAAAHAAPGTQLSGMLRGRALPVTVTELPFIPARFKR
ncbi:MAG: glycine cleavage system aminomethyltransferase GcvT [Pseudomonadota bacterium]